MKGNTQDAAIEATIERNRQNAALHNEQVGIYSGAVGVLGTLMTTWQGKRAAAVAKSCSSFAKYSKQVESTIGVPLTKENCLDSVQYASTHTGEAFANQGAKGQLFAITTEYVAKAAEARRKAGMSEYVAKKLEGIPQDVNDDEMMYEKCAMYPQLPECRQGGGPKGSGSNFDGAQFGFTGDGSNNAFNFDPNDPNKETDAEAAKRDSEIVATDVASPFEAEARKANEIINPAAGAVISPGGGGEAAGAGGGGGGGMGGGGGGGEGTSAKAPEAEGGEPEIKSNKYTASWSGGKGGKFEAVKGDKEDANPFASLFDSKGTAGGIEEDRSIASDDSAGASGIFEKISKRYGQMQADKRIEANNLE